jgi:hypothetical protein
MKALGLIVSAVVLQCALAGTLAAQTTDHLRIWIQGFELRDDGGEQPRVASAGRGLAIGQPVSAAIWKSAGACVLNAGSIRQEGGAEIGWIVEATPLTVVDDAITFRLDWRRNRYRGRDSSSPGATTQLTLRPGETMPVDIADVLATPDAAPCAYQRVALRVAVDYYPSADRDRRVVAMDLWLVRRPSNGSEQSELVSVRGQFNRPVPFYFSTVTDGAVSLDFFGELTVKPRDGYQEVDLVTRSRLIEGGRETETMPVNVPGFEGRQMFGARQARSTLQLRPDEVVSVELPRLSENDSGAFANQTLLITIRSRRIR